MNGMSQKVTLLAGGVGGAKMAEGLAALAHVELSVIGNIADDEMFHGLWVSPDIDTLTYSLAGLIDRAQGWGVADESHRALSMLERLGSDTWMSLGDCDFGLHIYRTERLKQGHRRSDIARDIAAALGVTARLVLPTDETVQTRVRTDQGWLSFQEYFVKARCGPEVRELDYQGLSLALATPEAVAAISAADLIVIAPSNPLVSIAPIVQIAGIRQALDAAAAPVVAVSPLIAGKVVKGPADRMMQSLGMRADALGVAQHYQDYCDGIVIDRQDVDLIPEIEALGMRARCADILMISQSDKAALAAALIDMAGAFKPQEVGA